MTTTPRAQLFLFPYSGVGASIYQDCKSYISSNILVHPVQYPGREEWIQEQPLSSMSSLVSRITEQYMSLFAQNLPLFFFGHCLGALVAYEIIVRLQQIGGFSVLQFFASGCPAPQCVQVKVPMADMTSLDFLRTMQNLHHFKSVTTSKSTAQITLAALKADFKIYENYQPSQLSLLSCPISVLYGDDDRYVAQSDVMRWREIGVNGFDAMGYGGDHLFINPHKSEIMKKIGLAMTDRLGC
jgi:surfactin synthase thioesterase subunit